MKISSNGIDLIKSFEGFRSHAYKCVSTEIYYTIGYGHYGSDVTRDMVITKEEALELLQKDIAKFELAAEPVLKNYVLNQNQYDALMSFTYNCGIGNLSKLTGYGSRSLETISEKMLLYTKSGGVRLQGLVKRRQKEQALFNTPVATSNDLYEVAMDVIAGCYGNGAARRIALEKAGFNYNEVQAIVNQILRG